MEKPSGQRQHEMQFGQGTILIVDDDQYVLEVGQAMLEALGYQSIAAGSGGEAVDQFEKRHEEIDLVVLDVSMQGMDGDETFDRLKEIDENVRVLIASGYSTEETVQRILERGGRGFIQKPFNIEQLSEKLQEIMVGGKG